MNLYEAKTHLSKLVDRAAEGEEIIIAKAGRPRARLVPLPSAAIPRRSGRGKGRAGIGPDFDAPLPRAFAEAFGPDGS
ncbi:MAG TPA: type II toxin-antitoxin system prevent-host-death family antitoxin [Geminicoccaceae bacterium]|nr:type II toxin-antitoxin system prevent-host-death family antitoxin [Geminicoccaceae bacterium]